MSTKQRRINQYELHERLETGTTNEIWKSFDTQRQRYVAIQIFHMNTQVNPGVIPHFLREAQGIASLRHPNIVQVLDFQASQVPNSSDSEAYLVTEYVEGQSLADYLHATAHQGKFLLPGELVRLLTSIAAALDYAHRQGIVHGNVQPGNILLDKRGATQHFIGEPRLTGFGTNYLQEPLAQSLSRAAYAAPEVAQGYAGNERSDLYSLGVLLYEMCTGALPFQGATLNDVLMQHIHATPTSPALINPHILPALTAVIMNSLAKNPAERFPTATAMVAAVARALNVPLPATGNTSPSLPSGSWPVQNSMNSPTYSSPLPQSRGTNPSLPASSAPVTPVFPSNASAISSQSSQQFPAMSTFDPDATIRRPPLFPVSPPPAPSPIPPIGRQSISRRRNLYIVLAAVLLFVLLASLLGAILLNNARNAPIAQSPPAGHAFFVSSGLLSQNSSQGITDGMQIDFPNIAPPPAGKSYYAWLLQDSQNDWQPLSLGAFTMKNGHVSLAFSGNGTHSDLLASYSRFLVTEEGAGTPPPNPSLDPSTWRYYAAFSQVKNPGAQYSLIDHVRHLLAQDPKLQAVGLTGGLDTWLFRNTLKILEEAGSVRDAQKVGTVASAQFMRRQLVRILDYLDSTQYIQRENLPADVSPVQVEPPSVVRVALLEFDEQNQNPPGYLKHIGNHLREIILVPGVTSEQKALALQINNDINNVQGWLTAVHKDAAQLVQMSDAQLMQPEALPILDDLFTQANYAFVGQVNPNTNQVREGVSQIHYNIQRLATFDITTCAASNGSNPCI